MLIQKQGLAENGGRGKYYHIVVRPKDEFVTFRYNDIGEPGLILRLAGKRSTGSWDDHAWLIHKKMAHVSDGKLVGDDPHAKGILKIIGPAKLLKGDVFKGHPRRQLYTGDSPSPEQQRAWRENIKRAQEARWR